MHEKPGLVPASNAIQLQREKESVIWTSGLKPWLLFFIQRVFYFRSSSSSIFQAIHPIRYFVALNVPDKCWFCTLIDKADKQFMNAVIHLRETFSSFIIVVSVSSHTQQRLQAEIRGKCFGMYLARLRWSYHVANHDNPLIPIEHHCLDKLVTLAFAALLFENLNSMV